MSEFKLFFASDIHGSDVCWKKFINAAKFHDCQVLVMGGDMTGKMLVPIVDMGGGKYRVKLAGEERTVRGRDEATRLHKLIADSGYYPYDTTPDEIETLQGDRAAVDRIFEAKMTETLERWLRIAEERLAGTDVQVFLGPANDDPPFIDEVLARGGRVQNPEGHVIELDGWRMVSVGYSNPTPWDTPRELPEDVLLERIESEVARLPSMERAIFNLHVPPKDSQLDKAALLNPDLSPVMVGGAPVLDGVGSTAVRTAIERHQPSLALHGHIHESRGAVRIGKTLCINPGSEYNDGVLRAALITLSDQGVRRHQLLSG